MVSIVFRQDDRDLLQVEVSYGQPVKLTGDARQLDFSAQPYSARLGRLVSWREDCEEWTRSLAETVTENTITIIKLADTKNEISAGTDRASPIVLQPRAAYIGQSHQPASRPDPQLSLGAVSYDYFTPPVIPQPPPQPVPAMIIPPDPLDDLELDKDLQLPTTFEAARANDNRNFSLEIFVWIPLRLLFWSICACVGALLMTKLSLHQLNTLQSGIFKTSVIILVVGIESIWLLCLVSYPIRKTWKLAGKYLHPQRLWTLGATGYSLIVDLLILLALGSLLTSTVIHSQQHSWQYFPSRMIPGQHLHTTNTHT